MTIALTILQLLCAVVLIVIVLVQSGKEAGLSSVFGGANDTFMARNKNKSLNAKLARATKWVGLAFVILTLVLTIIH